MVKLGKNSCDMNIYLKKEMNELKYMIFFANFYTPSTDHKTILYPLHKKSQGSDKKKVTKKFCTPLDIDEKISYPIIFFLKNFIPHYLFHLQLGIGT